jgi:hypothetical protein
LFVRVAANAYNQGGLIDRSQLLECAGVEVDEIKGVLVLGCDEEAKVVSALEGRNGGDILVLGQAKAVCS